MSAAKHISVAATESELPEGWAWAAVSEVTQNVPNVKPEAEPERIFGYVDISSVCNRTFRITDARLFKGKDAPSRARRAIRPGDVLFSNVRTYLRNVAIVPDGLDAQLCSTGFSVLRSNGSIESKLLFYEVLADRFIELVTPQQTGSQYPATSDRVVMSAKMPVPPLVEQKRIVERVEQLLARVNAARERLARVPLILKHFRQAVLAAAFSGRLTADWRERVSVLGSAGSFVQEILSERQAKWERGRYRPPVPYEDAELPDLPEGWSCQSFDTFVTDSFYGPRFGENEYSDKGIPTIRTTDISFDGSITLKDPPRIALKAEELRKFGLLEGDLLVTRTGATIGKCALYAEDVGPAIPGAYLIRFRLTRQSMPPRYLLFFLMSPHGQELLLRRSTAVAQPNVNATNISRFVVPLPPRQEIGQIIRRVEALFKLAGAIEKSLATATVRADKLTQAILAKAFRGELVPTEAELARREGRSYEPASALLARIRVERASAEKKLPSHSEGRPVRSRRLSHRST